MAYMWFHELTLYEWQAQVNRYVITNVEVFDRAEDAFAKGQDWSNSDEHRTYRMDRLEQDNRLD